jgi:hypothetical protein
MARKIWRNHWEALDADKNRTVDWIQMLITLLLQVVIIQPQDTGAKSHPFPHAVVAGYVTVPPFTYTLPQ